MLESGLQSDNTFVTLTYSDETLPIGSSEVYGPVLDPLPTLLKEDVQKWLKRLRKAIAPLKVRYFAVGEYGEKTQRPHYHLALFGYPNCVRGKTRMLSTMDQSQKPCCAHCDLIMRTWGRGHVMLGSLTAESSQYIAGYVTKKMTLRGDSRLFGRAPEFSEMSRSPGIGVNAMHDVASTLLEFNLDKTETDVPVSLRHGSRQMPLGTHLRRKLRTFIGRDVRAPQEAIDEYQKEMRPLHEAAKIAKEDITITKQLATKNVQKMRNLEAKQRIYKKKGSQ